MKSLKKKPSLLNPHVAQKKATDDIRSQFITHHKEELAKLLRCKSQYGKILLYKVDAQNEINEDAATKDRIERMLEEKDNIRAEIWVADSTPYKNLNKRYMEDIKCQINCQEVIAREVNELKKSTVNTQREIDRITQNIYQLNSKIVPECRHQAHVAEKRKKFTILENRLETGMRMECAITASNAKLRDELINLLIDRQSFNDEYSKMVQTLTSDKKYLAELIEYALQSFEQCINMYEKMEHYIKKDEREMDNFRAEIWDLQSRMRAFEDSKFIEHKQQPLRMADLLPKELKRREKLRNHYKRRITVYREVLDKLLEYTSSMRVEDVIHKFKEHEDVYYSYFTYSNEQGYHMTLINNTINRLYTEINNMKTINRSSLGEQLAMIGKLQNTLRQKRNKNDTLLQKSEQNDDHVEDLFTEIGTLCEITECDATQLWSKLGDNTQINLHNLAINTQMLEERIIDIIACVYCIERPFNNTVAEVEKVCEVPTKLSDIVLTQQCPECAQGEDMNVEEDGNNYILPREEIHKKLFDKLTQPEMQYYLHPLEQCRLPRSRILAAKKANLDLKE